ncbi:hypothetical protein [Fundidesulfovibrio soli]|uniref:hypothetical protein n=1 Tax=Fundidesulfovibrio soli TaxID=2922716 RepID=UPI001FAE7CF8|nr:hypothetical protein [Fundidesulfovibrio soli]
MKGVWDDLDKERVSHAVLTAFGSDEYLELLARINNADTPEEVRQARAELKDIMALWRQECPEYAFMVDCLYLFSEKMEIYLTASEPA